MTGRSTRHYEPTQLLGSTPGRTRVRAITGTSASAHFPHTMQLATGPRFNNRIWQGDRACLLADWPVPPCTTPKHDRFRRPVWVTPRSNQHSGRQASSSHMAGRLMLNRFICPCRKNRLRYSSTQPGGLSSLSAPVADSDCFSIVIGGNSGCQSKKRGIWASLIQFDTRRGCTCRSTRRRTS